MKLLLETHAIQQDMCQGRKEGLKYLKATSEKMKKLLNKAPKDVDISTYYVPLYQ